MAGDGHRVGHAADHRGDLGDQGSGAFVQRVAAGGEHRLALRIQELDPQPLRHLLHPELLRQLRQNRVARHGGAELAGQLLQRIALPLLQLPPQRGLRCGGEVGVAPRRAVSAVAGSGDGDRRLPRLRVGGIVRAGRRLARRDRLGGGPVSSSTSMSCSTGRGPVSIRGLLVSVESWPGECGVLPPKGWPLPEVDWDIRLLGAK
ncbi:hypothetical protein NF552_09410 [Roseomonas mucosa]|nr:hypothetical protein NF552_09410 [Roseomonas mucosa]